MIVLVPLWLGLLILLLNKNRPVRPVPRVTPAGWYRDPWRAAWWRYWDGQVWTGYTELWAGYRLAIGRDAA